MLHAVSSREGIEPIFDSLLGVAGSFDFQNIPGTYKHLLIELTGRGSDAGTSVNVRIRFNNDSGANYYTQVYAASAGTNVPFEDLGATSGRIGSIAAAGATAGFTGNLAAHVPDYAGTTFAKRFSAVGGRTESTSSGGSVLEGDSGLWNSTAAITRIALTPSAGTTFAIGTRATLYGLG